MGVRDRVKDYCSSVSSSCSYKQGGVGRDGCGWEEWGCEGCDEVPLAQSVSVRTQARYLDTGLGGGFRKKKDTTPTPSSEGSVGMLCLAFRNKFIRKCRPMEARSCARPKGQL